MSPKRSAGSYPRVDYNKRCHNSDGLNFCDCQLGKRDVNSCMFYGRGVEPLAFSLIDPPLNKQEQCPLFSVLPSEIRDLIYEFALTDCTSHTANSDNVFRRYQPNKAQGMPSTDIAFTLLQTCRAVYMEAYKWPLLLNTLNVYDFSAPTLPRLQRLAPWQFALISSVDISIQQVALESGSLRNYVESWKIQERHNGAYVVPRYYRESSPWLPNKLIQCSIFGMLPCSSTANTSLNDGDEVRLSSNLYPRQDKTFEAPTRAMVARPLTNLTIRMSRTDWWSWTEPFNATGSTQKLRLDPAFGEDDSHVTEEPSTDLMQKLTTQRQRGQQPEFGNNWGSIIGSLSDLMSFQLVLETFGEKKSQLEFVIECAKFWKFPLDETQYELVWDGKVHEANWKGDGTLFYDEDYSDETEDDDDEEEEDDDDDEEEEEEEEDDDDDEDEEESDDGDEEDDDDDEEEEEEEDEEDDDDNVSEVSHFSGESDDWISKSKTFEVRIMRFVRRRVR